MRLIRFGAFGQERPGILDKNGQRRDASDHFKDWNQAFFNEDGLSRLSTILSEDAETLSVVPESVRWGAPIARPGKVICIGLNFSDHAAESGMPIPAEPIVFMKAANTVVGPYDDVRSHGAAARPIGRLSLE